MSFIINQQAQFVADIQQLQATQAQTQNVVGQFANLTFEGFTYTLARFNDVNIKIDALVDSQVRTDESLRNLILVVDRYFSEGRNGQ